MFKLKISKEGIRIAAEREKGCDIQAGTDQDIDRSIKFWEKKMKASIIARDIVKNDQEYQSADREIRKQAEKQYNKPAPYKGLKCV